MSVVSSGISTPETSGESAPELSKREMALARRIAGRSLYGFQEDKLTVVVSGRFGVASLLPRPQIYEQVSSILSMADVEVEIYRISKLSAIAHVRDQSYLPVLDVVCAKSMYGFTKYPEPHPARDPLRFAPQGQGPMTGSTTTVEKFFPQEPQAQPLPA